MRKYIILPIALLILFFTAAQPAVASFCRNYKENRICILSIKRSAKNYWEYRSVKYQPLKLKFLKVCLYNFSDFSRL